MGEGPDGSARKQLRRSESSHRKILDAAIAICRDDGYASLSMESIARHAGVGKHTIYRRWPTKGEILAEALERQMTAGLSGLPDTGDLVSDMSAFVTEVVSIQARPEFGPALAALLAEAQLSPSAGPKLLQRLFKPRRAPIVERLRRAQEVGQLPPRLDLEAILEVVFGALYHRVLLRGGPLDESYAAFVVNIVFACGAGALRPDP